MYHFAQPTKKIVAAIKRTAAKHDTIRQVEKVYDLYTANVESPIGKLTVTYGKNEYNEVWVNVKAERYDDLGRNNTLGCDDLSSEGIALAIGFSCGSAFWRATSYR